MSSLLAAAACLVLGAIAGAALQRWSFGARSAEHLGPGATWTEPEDGMSMSEFVAHFDDLTARTT